MSRRPIEEIGGGTNARSLHDAIGTTSPGLPDEALAPGETLADELIGEEGEATTPAEPGPDRTRR